MINKRILCFFKQSIEYNRHALDKAHYKKSSVLQSIDNRDELIDQLLATSIELNDKVSRRKKNVKVAIIMHI